MVIIQVEGRGAWRVSPQVALEMAAYALKRQEHSRSVLLDAVYVHNALGQWEPIGENEWGLTA